MRITGGKHRGREVFAPKGDDTRPSSSLLREALFNILGSEVENALWLDLFSGSGIMAFEAISRGAKSATLVDLSPAAKKAALSNAERLGIKDQITFIKADAIKALKKMGKFNLIFADPPYGQEFGIKTIEQIKEQELLLPGGKLIIEEGVPIETDSLNLVKEKKYGKSFLYIFE